MVLYWVGKVWILKWDKFTFVYKCVSEHEFPSIVDISVIRL